jgi:hypothetical protein
MKPNQGQFYEAAGQEVIDCRFAPGPMARAFSEAMGHKEKTIALYIKYRVEELQLVQARVDLTRRRDEEARAEAEGHAIERADRKKKEENDAELVDQRRCEHFNITLCPNCAFYGEMRWSWVPFIFGCKCPKCKHRFDWSYHKVPAVKGPVLGSQ